MIDDWTQAYAFLSQVKMPLQAGPHQIELDYFVKRGWGKTKLNLGIVRPEELVSAEAKSIAAHADAVVVAVGFDPSTEGESGDRMFVLPPGQDELINQMAAINKNTVVAVTSGGGVDMMPWVDHVPGAVSNLVSRAGRRHGAGAADLRRRQPLRKIAHHDREAMGGQSLRTTLTIQRAQTRKLRTPRASSSDTAAMTNRE